MVAQKCQSDHTWRIRSAVLIAWAVLLVGCGAGAAGTALPTAGTAAPVDPAVAGLTLLQGFRAEVYATGLRQPTAMGYGPDNKLYVTQLNGGENDGVGQVVRLDAPNTTPIVVLEKLDKPTGLAWRDRELWLVTGRSIAQSIQTGETLPPPTIIVRDLPYNGRSNGQITLLPDRRLMFEASGSSDPNSARLLTLAPGETTPVVFATGFKGAYAHAVDFSSGALWTTEINDDKLAGRTPPEELNQLTAGKDYGWPRCYADQEPAPERGGSSAICKKTEVPVALFEANATPTGLEWGGNTGWPRPLSYALFTALWNGTPPRVTLHQLGDTLTQQPIPFVTGLERPIDVLGARDNGLLILDQAKGVIYRIVLQS